MTREMVRKMNTLNDKDFKIQWEKYIQTHDFLEDISYIEDLIFNYDCDNMEHLVSTDCVRHKIEYLFKELNEIEYRSNYEDNEYDIKTLQISTIIEYIFKTDFSIIRMYVSELSKYE